MTKHNLQKEIEEELEQETVVSAEDLDQEPECHNCGREMPYEAYNEKSPQDDYIVHVVPGFDEYTPNEKVLYCGVSCFIEEKQEFEQRS